MITPLQDFVLVRRKEPPKKSEFGILLPSNIDVELNLAEVIAVGELVKLPIKKGDTVIIQYGFDDIEHDGQKFALGKQEHIRATIT